MPFKYIQSDDYARSIFLHHCLAQLDVKFQFARGFIFGFKRCSLPVGLGQVTSCIDPADVE